MDKKKTTTEGKWIRMVLRQARQPLLRLADKGQSLAGFIQENPLNKWKCVLLSFLKSSQSSHLIKALITKSRYIETHDWPLVRMSKKKLCLNVARDYVSYSINATVYFCIWKLWNIEWYARLSLIHSFLTLPPMYTIFFYFQFVPRCFYFYLCVHFRFSFLLLLLLLAHFIRFVIFDSHLCFPNRGEEYGYLCGCRFAAILYNAHF